MNIACTTKCAFATVTELFAYKSKRIEFDPFPGYSTDQWGIKAHNRPYIVENAQLKPGEKVIEIGGAYSTLPAYLVRQFQVEAWIADDFGEYSGESQMWTRWGEPDTWIAQHPTVTYKKTHLGAFSEQLPDNYFDLVFSVSTLEHIPFELRVNVVRDMLRITKKGGRQIHLIDINSLPPRETVKAWLKSRIPFMTNNSDLAKWQSTFQDAGVQTDGFFPSLLETLDRRNLTESADVVYRFYPPNDAPKDYSPALSLILEITKT